jgi:hypothetical protein
VLYSVASHRPVASHLRSLLKAGGADNCSRIDFHGASVHDHIGVDWRFHNPVVRPDTGPTPKSQVHVPQSNLVGLKVTCMSHSRMQPKAHFGYYVRILQMTDQAPQFMCRRRRTVDGSYATLDDLKPD